MRIQLEQLDLLEPWPLFALRDGFREIRLLVRVGSTPIGQVSLRPAAKRVVTHGRLRRRIARVCSETLLKHLAHAALTAGPEALGWFLPAAWPEIDLARADGETTRRYVEQNFLLPAGLPSPLRDWVLRSLSAASPMPPVTIALCTRDRAATLEATIAHLRQLDYPQFDILVVDNSADSVPTREVADRLKVGYVCCKSPGVSRARNAALTHARSTWVAFIDDDCRPEKSWLKELVRPAQNQNCRCVTGLVLPAHLDSAAEIVSDGLDAHSDRFAARIFHRNGLVEQPWPALAGAAILVHRHFAQSIRGFDPDLGPGPDSVGGGEDAEFLERVLRNGGNVHYTPAAVVHHDRVMTARSLRRQVHHRAAGRAAILASRAINHLDARALARLIVGLPRAIAQEMTASFAGKSRYPFSLSLIELRATLAGPIAYAQAKLSRIARCSRAFAPSASTPNTSTETTGQPPAPINPKLAA